MATKDSREQLVDDLRTVIADAQALADDAKNASVDTLQKKAKETKEKLNNGMEAVKEGQQRVAAQASEYTDTAEQCIRKHPWQTVGLAALTGAVAGLLIKKR